MVDSLSHICVQHNGRDSHSSAAADICVTQVMPRLPKLSSGIYEASSYAGQM